MSPQGRVYISRHVVFNHYDFPFNSLFDSANTTKSINNTSPQVPLVITVSGSYSDITDASDSPISAPIAVELSGPSSPEQHLNVSPHSDSTSSTRYALPSTLPSMMPSNLNQNESDIQIPLPQENAYMTQPEDFTDPNFPNHACKLNKTLYGLKQASRAWFDSLRLTLLSWGFSHSKADSSLFFLHSKDKIIFILIYVDDILVAANKQSYLIEITSKLNDVYALKDLGALHYFLGIQISRDQTGFHLSHTRYIENLLQKYNMQKCTSCSNHMTISSNLFSFDSDSLPDASTF